MTKNKLKFLIEVSKLKEFPRTGWVLRNVKNPETIAEHTFRVAIANWILGEKANLKVKKIIEMSLFHDLCEVYAGDVTPFFYYIRDLPKDKKERERFLRKYVRLSRVEKEKRGKEKYELEKNSLLKLLKFLEPNEKEKIFSLWIDFEKKLSKEGDFARQVDKIETLLQAIEYFGTGKNSLANGWWEEVEEITHHPLLLEFLKAIQKRFYKKAINYKKNKELEKILDFILKIGKLKKLSRLYWKLRGIKNPETVAGHIFTLSVMAWIFGSEERKLNLEKLLKMALCHEITAIETGDTTPYDRILKSKNKEREKILARMIRLSEKEKRKNFWKDYKIEKKALKKLTKNLDKKLKDEIINLWEEYRKKQSPEGIFLSQLNTIAILFQGILYKKKQKEFSTLPLWEWTFESVSDPLLLEFLEELKKYEKN